MEIQEKKFDLDNQELLALLGYNDTYLRKIESKFQAIVTVRGSSLIIQGGPSDISAIEKIFGELSYMVKKNGALTDNDVDTVLDLVGAENSEGVGYVERETVIYSAPHKIIRARNARQLDYYKKVKRSDLVFSIGPAGTGKTFLAVAMALDALKSGRVSKIILSRPAVEAGESLGFLPGDLKEKLGPYLRPLTDALHIMATPDRLNNMMEKNVIEITPLAYMRGRTLSNAFIILDEAQNSTITQMKMFLTRMGENSKAIVTGDITQIDLLNKKMSGLVDANSILKKVPGIEFVYFDKKDVIRHKLVAEIINAYEEQSKTREKE